MHALNLAAVVALAFLPPREAHDLIDRLGARLPRPIDEHTARGAAFAAFAQVRGCRQWSEIEGEFAVAAERWLAGKRLPWETARSERAASKPVTLGAIDGIDVSVLGLEWPVTLDEARNAYRTRALACHPDRGGSHDEMLALNHTWAALKKAFGER